MVKVSEIHWNPLKYIFHSLFLQLNIQFFHGENSQQQISPPEELGARLEQGESAKEKLRSEKESLEALNGGIFRWV